MCVKIYNHKSIVKINDKGLIYINENKDQVFIDFNECRKNWVKYVNASNNFNTKALKEEDTTCVGQRDICANPSFIEIFSEPRVHFIFPYEKNIFERIVKTPSRKKYKYFLEVQKMIKESGWSTFDLS